MKAVQILTGIVAFTSSSFGEQVYIAAGSAGIRIAELDEEKGTLSPLNEAVSLPGAGFLALHPTKPVLYATCYTQGEKGKNGAIGALQILEDGTLDVLNRSLTESRGACHVSVDATGQVVFASNYSSGSVVSYQAKKDGSLSEPVSVIQHEGSSILPGRQDAPHAHYLAAGPENKFAYAPDLGLDQVVIYDFDTETAKLVSVGAGKVAPGGGPRHMKFSADGRFAYVLNELNVTVTIFTVNSEDGSLAEHQTLSAVPEGTDKEELSCAEIVVHPSGKFVYTSQRDLRTREKGSPIARNSLSVYKLVSEGKLERIQTVSAGVRIPRNFNLSSSGKWLLAGGQFSSDVQVFAVDEETGQLTAKGDPVACPGRPTCFVFRGE